MNENFHGGFNIEELHAVKLRNEVISTKYEIRKRNLQIASLIIMIAAGLVLTLYNPLSTWNLVAFSYL